MTDIQSTEPPINAQLSEQAQRIVYGSLRAAVEMNAYAVHSGHIALAIIERHETLTRFLRLFGIDEETIYKDVEGMEHHVSRPTLKVISAVADALEADPELLERVRQKSR